jgi:hypothetical protein
VPFVDVTGERNCSSQNWLGGADRRAQQPVSNRAAQSTQGCRSASRTVRMSSPARRKN